MFPVFTTHLQLVCNNLILSIRQVEWASDEEDEADDDADDDEDDEDEEEEAGQVEGEAPKTEGDGASAVAKRQKARAKKKEEDENEEVVLEEEEEWNFPVDKDNWTEADLGEEWADPTPADDTVGRDPETAEDDEELIAKLKKDGRAPPRRPYYVPYRKWYPPIPEDHPDIDSPETVVEELERMEEFLVWASYVFEDGSSYTSLSALLSLFPMCAKGFGLEDFHIKQNDTAFKVQESGRERREAHCRTLTSGA